MSRRVLVVCTANVCRSPMAAALVAHHLGAAFVVTSAGTHRSELGVDPNAVAACVEFGVDLGGHVPRQIDRRILDEDGADLVITMTREQLRTVATTSHNVLGRVFTMRELVRRASGLQTVDRSWDQWRDELAIGRSVGDLMGDDEQDDIADPFALGRTRVAATAREIDALAAQLAVLVPR